ncbi:hypothetical protein NT6N_12970 [Oceaniferula spumae]|uniref:Uncharacterized protein n=1 Tax=Oceaniferula spumae TaxID=2979115 RepID=A0AAT9FJY1_9BACT
MSQQGIFSIAPDAQPSAQNGSSNGSYNGQNGSPFASAGNQSDQNSPFAAVTKDSPFQHVAQPAAEERGAIPQPRPEGQPPALGVAADSPVTNRSEQPQQEASQPNAFEAAHNGAGGPFQMNGFSEQQGGQFMEAAPVAPAAKESSPFVAVNAQHDQHDYEAAKAGLEPQQDFAAVQPRYQVSEPAAQEPRATQPLQQAQPTQAMQSAQPAQSEPAYQAAPAPAPALQATASTPEPRQEQAAPKPQPFAASSSRSSSTGFQQLELRAIFGVDHILTVDEILQRARTLPGIRNVAVVNADESSALSNFRQALQGMGFGNSDEMKLSSGGGSVDFLTEGDATVAVLHEGGYGPGVQETLIIVAREIGKLV